VADLRAEPQEIPGAAALKRPYDMDPLQETQLLYNEEVKVLEEREGWVRVEAVEQPEYTHHDGWEGYPGWVLKKELVPKPENFSPNAVVSARYARVHEAPSLKSAFEEFPLGARLQIAVQDKSWARVLRPGRSDGWARLKDLRLFSDLPKDEESRRKSILAAARLFLGELYYWGGRAGHREDGDRPSGVDCSGLVNLAYRVSGVDVPRDSHEQRMKSRPLSYSQIKPGDLVFLAKTDKPHRIVHVMLFAGGDRVIEAVHEFNTVRRTTVRRKLGKPLRDIQPREEVNGRFVYLGRLLPE
jgi:cell wall-associated NlpC family hydrolase